MKIVICGYLGYGNVGDEAILSGIICAFKKWFPGCEITVLSNHPNVIRTLHRVHSVFDLPTGIRSFASRILSGDFFKTIKELKTADIFIFAGGGLLSDELRLQNVIETFIRVRLSRIFCPYMITYSIGAGPFITAFGKWLTRRTFHLFDRITVRDRDSENWLKRTGLKNKIFITPDPGVFVIPDNTVILKDFSGNPINKSEKNKVGIAPAAMYFSEKIWHGKGKDYPRLINAFAKIGDFAAENLNAEIFLFQLSPDVDTDFCKKIQRTMKNHAHLMFTGYNPAETAGAFSQMDMIIGARFHSIVLSASAGIPFVAIIYHHKIKCFLENIGQFHRSMSIGFDINAMLNLIADTWENRQNMKAELEKIMPELRQKAESGYPV